MRRTAALVTALALATSGCSAFSDDGSDGATTVAAAFYPLGFVAERVAGEHADVELLTSPGGEAHDLEPSVQETAEIAQASLVVHLGGFQPAIDAAVEENATGEVLDAADVVSLQPFSEHDSGHEDEHAEHEGEDEHAEHEGEDAEHEDEHSHDGHNHEGDLDPHFWLDPVRMADLGDAVADALADVDPDHADDFRAGADALRADLEDLDRAYAEGLADCERHVIVASHDAFGYLARYGVEVAPVAGLSPEATPTPAVLGDLQELIREEGITTVFSERLASTRFTDGLARDLDLRSEVLDPLEGLTDETADEDYVTLMEQNLEVLREANACR